jgi:GTP pyrophosphokinase
MAQLVDRVGDDPVELEPSLGPDPEHPRSSDAVVVEHTDDIWVTVARCCSPVPFDPIIGFITATRGVSVHHESCPNAEDLRRDLGRLAPVRWDTKAPAALRVNLKVEALDRKQLLRDICTVLGDLQVNIISAQVTTQRDRVAYLQFAFEVGDIAHLDHIIGQVRRVESVFDAYRIVPRSG